MLSKYYILLRVLEMVELALQCKLLFNEKVINITLNKTNKMLGWEYKENRGLVWNINRKSNWEKKKNCHISSLAIRNKLKIG